MKPTEIKDIVVRLLMIIFVAIALGKYSMIEDFARVEAAKTFKIKAALLFFPQQKWTAKEAHRMPLHPKHAILIKHLSTTP